MLDPFNNYQNNNLIPNELIKIELKKLSRNPKEKYSTPVFKLSITNLDNFLSEKIMFQTIQFKNLFYKTYIYTLNNFDKTVRANFVPKFPTDPAEFRNPHFLLNNYVPGKVTIVTELTNNSEKINFDSSNLYKIKVNLIEKNPKTVFEREINYSNEILFNPKIGLVTEKYIQNRHKEIYRTKKIFRNLKKIILNMLMRMRI